MLSATCPQDSEIRQMQMQATHIEQLHQEAVEGLKTQSRADLERIKREREEKDAELQRELIRVKMQSKADQEHMKRQREEQDVELQRELASVKASNDVAVLDLQTQLMNLARHNETLTEHLDEFERQSAQWGAEKSTLSDEKAKLENKVMRWACMSPCPAISNLLLTRSLPGLAGFSRNLSVQINTLQLDFQTADAENAALRAQNMKMAQQIVALESEDLQQQYMDLMSENEELVRQKLEALHGQSSLEVRVSEMVVKNASLSAELVQARVEQGVLQEVSQVEFKRVWRCRIVRVSRQLPLQTIRDCTRILYDDMIRAVRR
jgi:hypothetical protein